MFWCDIKGMFGFLLKEPASYLASHTFSSQAMAVTPQVFSSIIALHVHKHKHASFILFYVVATNVIVFLNFV
jgi:hypothetical protein